jgi:hypothetical protein
MERNDVNLTHRYLREYDEAKQSLEVYGLIPSLVIVF